MGRDFDAAHGAARAVYDEASDALGFDVRGLCFEPDERLGLTEWAQPAILATEIAMLRALEAEWGLAANWFGGHSLGEYTALVAAGVMPLAEAVRIVRVRGRLMQEAVPVGQGAMLAVIGPDLDHDVIGRACAGLAVTVANDNAPDQVVLSGLARDLPVAADRLVGAPVRTVPLDVSAPFHSPLMAPVAPALAEVLADSAARWDVAWATRVTSNLTGGFHDADRTGLVLRLVRQMTSPVRWRANMAALAAIPGRVIEVGPGRPLRGFWKAVGVTVASITDLRSGARALAAEGA